MKKIAITVVLGCYSIACLSQVSPLTQAPKFDQLKINSAPAFTILGVDPANIQRPSTPKQIVSGIQNSISGGQLQPGLAFEISPFYILDTGEKYRFHASNYLVPNSSIFKTMGRNFSISVGTSAADTAVFGKLTPGTALGFGIRTVIIDGKPQNDKVKLLQSWNKIDMKYVLYNQIMAVIKTHQIVEDLPQKINTLFSTFKSVTLENQDLFINSLKSDLSDSVDKIESQLKNNMANLKNVADLQSLSGLVETKMNELYVEDTIALNKLNASTMPYNKTGFMLEIDAADALMFQNTAWDQCYQAKGAIWLIPSYRWQLSDKKNSLFDLMAVIRYTWNNKKAGVDTSNYFDTGLKLQYGGTKLTIGFEGVYRYASIVPASVNKHDTYRWTASLNYKLTDDITFTASYGANFNGNTTQYSDPKKVFAIAGINFGL